MRTLVIPFLVLTVVDALPLRGQITLSNSLKEFKLGFDEKLPTPTYEEDPPSWQELKEDAPTWQELEKQRKAMFNFTQWVLSTSALQRDHAHEVSATRTATKRMPDLPPLKMLCIWCIVVLSSILYAVCGLGNALLFHGLYMFCSMAGVLAGDVPDGNVREPVLYICITSPAIQIIQVYNLWVAGSANTKELNKPLALTFAASMQLGLFPGLWLLASVQTRSTTLQMLLAVAMAATLAAKLSESSELVAKTAGQKSTCADITILGVLLTVVLCGVGAGFCQGAVGVGGAAKMIMILILEISNKEWRSTACIADTPLQIMRFTLLVMAGHIDIAARWVEICALYAGVFIGLFLGNMLAPLVSGKNFTRVVMSLMCFTMFRLCALLLWDITSHQLYLLMASSSLLVCATFLGLLVGLGVAVRGKFGTLLISARWYYMWVARKKSPNFVRGISGVLSVIFGAATYWVRPAPSVWIIGEKKAGTTSLHYYLSQHPNIVQGLAKETHFFSGRNVFGPALSKNVHLLQGFYPTLFYHFIKKLFSPLGVGQPVIAIEATPWNMMLPWAIDGIQELAAGQRPAKVIAILREPVDRAESDYRFEFARKDEAASFEGALQAEKTKDAWFWEDAWHKCVAEGSLRRMWTDHPNAGTNSFDAQKFRHPPLFAYERRGHYIVSLRPWLDRFSSDNLMLLSYDELINDPMGTTNMVYNWLGLLPYPARDVSAQNVNPSHKDGMDPETRRMLEERYTPTLTALMQEANFPMASNWLRSYGLKPEETDTASMGSAGDNTSQTFDS